MNSQQYVYENLESLEYSRFLHIKERTIIYPLHRSIDNWSYEIHSIERSRAPSFEAISYSWDSSERTHTLWLADGCTLPITASVAAALPYLAARSTTNYLWIDQICINQDDILERNSQIQIMGDIFRTTEQVLAWLGLLDRVDSLLLMQLVKVVEEERGALAPRWLDRENWRLKSRMSALLSTQLGKHMHLNALVKFLGQPWFRRGWVFQEAVLCPSLVFLLGEVEIRGFGMLDSLITAISNHDEKVEEFSKFSQSRGYQGALSLINEREQRHSGTSWAKRRTFAEFLSEIAGREVSDPRDHVYGFLGFQNDPRISILPDYNLPVEVVFTETTKAVLAGTLSLDALGELRQPRIPSSEREDDDLPSWVPDWSLPRWLYPFCKTAHGAYSPVFNASAGRMFTPEKLLDTYSVHLSIQGRQIDSITYVIESPLPAEGTTRLETVLQRLSFEPQMAHLAQNLPFPNVLPTQRLIKVLLADGAIGAYGLSKSDNPLTDRRIAELFGSFKEICATQFPSSRKDLTTEEYLTYNRLNWDIDVLFDLSQVTINRRTFCTAAGKLGLGPCIAEIGDRIVVAHGSRTPLVLRPTGAVGKYWLIGQCYLEDVMYGEACTWAEDNAHKFILC